MQVLTIDCEMSTKGPKLHMADNDHMQLGILCYLTTDPYFDLWAYRFLVSHQHLPTLKPAASTFIITFNLSHASVNADQSKVLLWTSKYEVINNQTDLTLESSTSWLSKIISIKAYHLCNLESVTYDTYM